MMKKEVVVYFGIIDYNSENAMCQRAEGIKKLISTCGYISKIIAVNSSVYRNSWKKRNDEIYEINLPKSIVDWIYSCLSIKNIKNALNDIGLNRIKTLIMADYRYIPMKRMAKFCKKNNINFVVDIMDWFIAGKTLNSKIKKLDNDLRMKRLYPKITNRIYICSNYEDKLGTSETTAIIPSIAINEKPSDIIEKNKDKIVLFFAGNPGKYCEKEKIDWVINAFNNKYIDEKFLFYIIGVEKKKYIENNALNKIISDNIIFLGRVSHKECVELLRKSDFSLVIRENNKLSNYGFSTKIGEAFANGIPVIATNTSDNDRYINDGINGYLIDCTEDALEKLLMQLLALERSAIDEIKKNVRECNPLSYDAYIQEFSRVL